MNKPTYTSLGFGITCIDAGYLEHGIACLYLMEEGGECAVLETGTCHSVPALQQLLSARGITPQQVRYVIPTHVHLDHAGGAGLMMAMFPEALLLIHPRGARHMADPTRLIEGALQVYGAELFQQLYGTIVPIDPARMLQMEDGQSVSLAGRRLEFRHTRGHADHHFCVWDEASRGWFSGDMFGVSYPWCRFPQGDFLLPSTTPSQFDPQAHLASLELLGSYTPQRIYLTHYGVSDYTREKAQLLASQIKAYCEFATANATDVAALQQCLSDYTVTLLRQHDAASSEAELQRKLTFDMQLNAQGLNIWRSRLDAA